MPIADATDPTMKYFVPASPPALVSLWKPTRTYEEREASSRHTNSMNRWVDLAIRDMPRPRVRRRMWKSACLLLSYRAEVFAVSLSSSSSSAGAAASGSDGSLWVAETVHRMSTHRNRLVIRELKGSTSRVLPIPPDPGGSRRARVPASSAATRVASAMRLGSLGSLVAGNLVPPISTGILLLVRGILNLASPRFGTMIIAARPIVMISSGSRSCRSMPSSSDVMASPPPTAWRRRAPRP